MGIATLMIASAVLAGDARPSELTTAELSLSLRIADLQKSVEEILFPFQGRMYPCQRGCPPQLKNLFLESPRLSVDGERHALHRFANLGFVDQPMVQPVRDMLGRDTQRCEVFHQANVVDVGHRRAADSLADPANDVAEDRLAVVVEFGLDVGFGQLTRQQRDRGQIVDRSARSVVDLFLARRHVGVEVVGGVQGGCGG